MSADALSSLLVILAVVALAPMVADGLSRWVPIPGVVLEIIGGIAIGPVLGWAADDTVIDFLAQLGLCTLMFLGGLEVDLPRVRGRPLRRSAAGWGISLALGLAFGFSLSGVDGPRSGMIVGLCLTTTALGILLPILGDRGDLKSEFGTNVLAGASMGEVGPIVAAALLLGTDRPVHLALVLIAFAAAMLIAARLAVRERNARLARVIEATLDTSGQLGVRLVVLTLVAMVWLAAELGLDVLIGAFAAGMVARLFSAQSSGEELRSIESKIHGLGFGFLVPIFFVVTGIRFDVHAIVDDVGALAVVPLLLVALLVVRGVPTALLHRDFDGAQRVALACYLSTALPLIVVLTTIGVATDRLSSATAASLVAAGMTSVVVFPLIAQRCRSRVYDVGTASRSSRRDRMPSFP
jgi:Kef-type K+ transport system membrane component KefB